MGITLGNLLGLWGLLGVPAVLLIHFIQRRYLKLPVSTLFLLEQAVPKEVEGRQFRWIRNSLQLWLQLLAVLLATFLLSDPKRITPSPVQRIVLIVDSSFSMAASKDRMLKALPDVISELERAARTTEWLLYESNMKRDRLYRGWSSGELLQRLQQWQPTIGEHNVPDALREIQEGIGTAASYYLLTDHRQQLSKTVSVLSYGEEVQNWGLIGLRIEDGSPLSFRVLLRNFARAQGERKWWIERSGATVSEGKATLSAGGITTIGAQFPAGVDELTVHIEGDAYNLDDALPIRRPQPRQMKVYAERGDYSAPFRRILGSIRSIERANKPEGADLRFILAGEESANADDASLVVFYPGSEQTGDAVRSAVTAERSPLVEGLSWESVVASAPGNLRPDPGDETILWAGKVPLAFVQKHGKHSSLVLNFDVRKGNALQHPALVLLLNRFAEQVRARSSAPLSQNFELSESLPPVSSARGELHLRVRPLHGAAGEYSGAALSEAALLRAPSQPSFFDLADTSGSLIAGSASYADARESDFTGFQSFRQDSADTPGAQAVENTFELTFPFWILGLILVLLASWSADTLRKLKLPPILRRGGRTA